VDVLSGREAWRASTHAARRSGGRLGFVPTMGALHAGHRSLVDAARASCETVAASIFVNPLQFGDAGDLAGYPRSLDDDLALLEEAGCDLVFAPSVEEIYPGFPQLPATAVSVGGVALGFEGSDRPGHFDGMATVVALLFNLTGPCRSFFGEKDFQQLCVIRQLVRDLAMGVEVVGCPTVREAEGLALSSRNQRLTGEGRLAARSLSRALCLGVEAAADGRALAEVEAAMAGVVEAEDGVELFYAAAADPMLMTRPLEPRPGDELRLLIAAEVEGIRLLDNAPARFGPR
jgi:pantoate--beta-alanine ligase